jgi:hypothetical protein
MRMRRKTGMSFNRREIPDQENAMTPTPHTRHDARSEAILLVMRARDRFPTAKSLHAEPCALVANMQHAVSKEASIQ